MTLADLSKQFREQVGAQQPEQPQQQAPEFDAPEYQAPQQGGTLGGLASRFRQQMGLEQPQPERPAYIRPEIPEIGGYWNDPKRVALHYYDILADNGTTDWTQRGIDPGFVEQAYKYYQSQNQGLPFYEWGNLAPNDEFAQLLSEMGAPADGSQISWDKQTPYFERLLQELGLVSQDGAIIPTAPEQQIAGAYPEIPAWQRMVSPLASPGPLQTALSALPFGVAGALAGAAVGGPLGGIIGAVGMGALGGAAMSGALRRKFGDQAWVGAVEGLAQGSMQLLGAPAQIAEQAIGTIGQIGNPALEAMSYSILDDILQDPNISQQALEKSEEVKWLLDNLPAVWESSKLTYESLGAMEGPVSLPSRAPAAIEYAIDMATQGMSDVQLAQAGQVYVLGEAEPVNIGLDGVAILNTARQEIINGADPRDVIERWQGRLGWSTLAQDIFYQSVLDPLNLAPMAGKSIISAAAKDNPALQVAVKAAGRQGPLSTMQIYREVLKSSTDVADIGRWGKRLAGLTDAGIIAELDPNIRATNAWAKLNQLTPEARGLELSKLFVENSVMIDHMAQGDYRALFDYYRKLEGISPIDAARLGQDLIDTPEIATVRMALSGTDEKVLNMMEAVYNMGKNRRVMLENVSKLTGENYFDTIKTLIQGTDGEIDNLLARLTDKLRQVDGGEAILKSPDFNPAGFRELGAYFKENPWAKSFDHMASELRARVGDRVSDWCIRSYGVKAAPEVQRFFGVMKNVQSTVLLNMNPMYPFNNWINGVVTRAFEGTLGLRKSSAIMGDLSRMKVKPFRLKQGVGLGGDVDLMRAGRQTTRAELMAAGGSLDDIQNMIVSEIEASFFDATKADDMIAKMQNATRELSSRVKLFGGVASADEAAQSLQAMGLGTLGARSRAWREGAMIPGMSAGKRAIVDAYDPGLMNKIMRQVENAYNLDELDQIANGVKGLDAADYVSDAARNLGKDPGAVMEMMQDSGILPMIDDALREGKSIPDAFAGADQHMQDWFKTNLKGDLDAWGAHVRDIVNNEGGTGLLRTMLDTIMEDQEISTRHFDEWERTMDLAYRPGVTRDVRDALIRQRDEFSRGVYDRHNSWLKTTWKAALDATGEDAGIVGRIVDGWRGMHDGWRKFFNDRRKMRNDWFNGVNERNLRPGDPDWIASYDQLQAKLAEMYAEQGAQELTAIRQIGADMVDVWSRQYGSEKAVGFAEWWKQVHDAHAYRLEATKDFRAWETGVSFEQLTTPEVKQFISDFVQEHPLAYELGSAPPSRELRHKAWPEFVEKVYLKQFADQIKGGFDGANNMLNDLRGRFAGNPAESEAMRFFGKEISEGLDQAKRAKIADEYTETTNAGILGPRGTLEDRYPELPPVFAEGLSDSIMYAAREMYDLLPAGEDAVINIITPEGGYRASQNPQWYVDLYNELGGVNRETVENALKRIIEDGKKDWVRANERTIAEVKRAVLDYMRKAGYPEIDLFDTPTPGELLSQGKLMEARASLDAWMGSDYAARFTEADWSKLTGGRFEYLLSPVEGGPPAAGRYAMGTTESVGNAPFSQVRLMDEVYNNKMRPLLDEMMGNMIDNPPGEGANIANMPADVRQALTGWFAEAKQEMPKANHMASRIGELRRDMALLNYSRRYNFDNIMGVPFPYEFWMTRSMLTWSLRMADRPAIAANFARWVNMSQQQSDKMPRIPSRLRGKLGIMAPWLPDWAGDQVFVDVLGKAFPFREFLRPIESALMDQTRYEYDAQDILYEWASSGQISREEAQQATQTKSGALWERAFTQAQQSEDRDWVDFMGSIMSPALYLTLPYQLATGQYQEMGQMPPSRMLQALSGATGNQDLANYDPFARFMKAKGVSEFGEWGDYYIKRQAVGLLAEGQISEDEFYQVYFEGTGPAYEMAQQRVREELAFRLPGGQAVYSAFHGGGAKDILGAALFGWLPGAVFPEGEMQSRGLKDEYQAAWQQYNLGDRSALDAFYSAHPEYQARMALFAEPEEQMQKHLVNKVWELYGDLPGFMKDDVADMFGDEFEEVFGYDGSRNYDQIPTEVLAQWVQELGGYAPGYEQTATEPLALPMDPAQQFEQMKAEMFPGVDALYSFIYSLPESEQGQWFDKFPVLDQYRNWKTQFMADNPALIPYMVSEGSRLAGATPEVQELVYQYWATSQSQFGDTGALWDQYFGLPSGQRKQFMREHPELGASSDYKKQFAAWYPQTIPYLYTTDDGIKETIPLGDQFQAASVADQMSSELQRHLAGGGKLYSGDYAELRYIWEGNGRPFQTFDEWLQALTGGGYVRY